MKSHPRQLRWKMVSGFVPTHLVSCNKRIYGFSTLMQYQRILCLYLSLSPLIFQVILFIILIGEVGGGIPSRAFGFVLSWAGDFLLLLWAAWPICIPSFCFLMEHTLSLCLDMWLFLALLWIKLWNRWRLCGICGVVLHRWFADPLDWVLVEVFIDLCPLDIVHPAAFGCPHWSPSCPLG